MYKGPLQGHGALLHSGHGEAPRRTVAFKAGADPRSLGASHRGSSDESVGAKRSEVDKRQQSMENKDGSAF